MPKGKVIDPATQAAIVAHRVASGSQAETARAFGISSKTVARVLASRPELVAAAQAKKDVEAATMAEYLEQSRAQAQAFIGKALKALADDDKISKATLVQIATAIGAESWNSVPGTMPGMRKVPDTAIRTARSAVSQQSMMSFLSLVAQMAFSFCMLFSFVKMGGRG